MQWSDPQEKVIGSIKNNTLVSASAGSGKTAVMIERILRLITGDNKLDKIVPIKRIIMVTFTEAVAGELKLKIAKALKKAIATSPKKEFLREQIEDMPLSHISTIHALCADLIRTNFEDIDIDPSFKIADAESATMLFSSAVETILKKKEQAVDEMLLNFVNFFGGRSEFIVKIKAFCGFIVAQADREKFLSEIATNLCDIESNNNALLDNYMISVVKKANKLVADGEEFAKAFNDNAMSSHILHVEKSISMLEIVAKASDFKSLMSLCAKTNFDIDRCPSIRNADDVVKEYAEKYRKFNEYLKKNFFSELSNLANLFMADTPQKANNRKEYIIYFCNFAKEVMSEYSAQKLAENLMDFNDLEYYAVKLLSDDKFASEMREKYDYICVDEYQDINTVQEFILTRLSNGSNLFMVGDPKQGIYGFRLSDSDIFIDKLASYNEDKTKGESCFLNNNYRSCKEILNFVNDVFSEIMTVDFGGVDYAKTSKLEWGNKAYFSTSDNPIKIVQFYNDKAEVVNDLPEDMVYSVKDSHSNELISSNYEALYIAEQIESLVGKQDICVLNNDNEAVVRKVEYGDIAILCANRSLKVESIITTLFEMNIPVDSSNIAREKTNLSVGIIIDFLKVIDNPKQDIALISAMSNIFGGFSESELAYVRQSEFDRGEASEKYFYMSVEKYLRLYKEGLDERIKIGSKIEDFYKKLDMYRVIASFSSVSTLIKDIIGDKHYDDFLRGQEGGKLELLQLENFLRSIETKLYNNNLHSFLCKIEETPDVQKISATETTDRDCICTNTIHGSKGLEYPIVFIVDFAQIFKFDETTSRLLYDKRYGIAIKDIDDKDSSVEGNTAYTVLQLYKKERALEEKMRLMYVALTRAKNMLYITATKRSAKTNVKFADVASSMLDWLQLVADKRPEFFNKYFAQNEPTPTGEIYTPHTHKFCAAKPEIVSKFKAYTHKEYPYKTASEMAIKHSISEVNSLSARDLPTDYGVALPLFKENSTEKGIAYHRALECIDFDCDTLEDVKNRLKQLQSVEKLTPNQYEIIDPQIIFDCLSSDIMKYARNNYHLREREFMLNISANEVFADCDIDEKVLLQGTVDLMIVGKQNILVDFKFSGRGREYLKEKYKRQLQLYGIAIENCMSIKVDKKLLYVLGQNEIIEIE